MPSLRTDWHIFRCAHEARVRDMLKDRGLGAMAPYTQSFEVVSRSKIVSRSSAVFPGYVFVEMKLEPDGRIQSSPSLMGLVSHSMPGGHLSPPIPMLSLSVAEQAATSADTFVRR